jgi:hypothetical protein
MLIAGTGKKVGKTALACNIIGNFKELGIVGIKITHHFYELDGEYREIAITPQFTITEELQPADSKDSRRMKRAGARKVYYIQCADNNLGSIIQYIPELSENSITPVVCESGALRNFIKPGLFILVKCNDTAEIKPEALPLFKNVDKVVSFENNKFDFDFNSINFQNNQWGI